jgi:hypothetical protein
MAMPGVTFACYCTHSHVYVLYICWFNGVKENIMNGKYNNHDKKKYQLIQTTFEEAKGQHEVWSSSVALKWDKYKKLTCNLDTLQLVQMRN